MRLIGFRGTIICVFLVLVCVNSSERTDQRYGAASQVEVEQNEK